ncbi:hypothetical protein CHLRE_09g386737v5 [Chlamydomonas reinhardtii]|uniref:Glycosyltransferase family 92 protein n=1 Tax=Chlamydomonas reinhardtii TaxID=3055 RepID=A0A2K3DCF3_CHLRE|nr:uncharacterized protein CHLRE_09g386737v5 [Chlamydomonas reinhardtii]PNW78216.1 hypothetical protein CHLRE_09g386737v5 [Chlamydomonas reinhardtii]
MLQLVFVLLVFLHSVPASGYRSKGAYAAICTNVKDEGLNLVEFILYHEWVGFGKIYVMDYNSSRPLSNMRMLLPFIRSGLVEYHYDADPRHHSPRRGGVFADYSQGTAFQRCIDFAHRDHMWMAFIDADEYLIVRDSSPPRNSSAASPPPPPPPPPQAAVARPNISALLRHYEQYPGVGVNMRYFGSSGHVQRPTAGTLEAYTACSPAAAWDNRHIKTIARMSAVLAIGGNPHEFVYIGGGVAVNELGLPVQGPESLPVSWSRLALHHYVTRSLSEFLAKMRRGPGGSQNRRTLDWFRAYDGNATETCGEGPALWQACCAERYEALRAEWLAAAARGRARRRGGDGGA